MSSSHLTLTTRRRLLKFLAASPIAAVAGSPVELLARLAAHEPGGASGALETLLGGGDDPVITAPDQALNVLDFEAAARAKVPPAHFAYLATGVDGDATVRANEEGFTRIQIRARRLVDMSRVDTSVEIFGTRWETPIVVSPVSSQKAFHPEGEIAVARAARAKGHLQLLSTVTTSAVEAVNEARGTPVWYQLYPTDDWQVGRALVKRAQAAGCPVLVLTVDLHGGSNRETQARGARVDTRPCASCHTTGFRGYLRRKPMFDGLDTSRATDLHPADMTWDVVKRLRDLTTMKLVVKGLVTREDAELAVQHGVDGIVVSNHGGRAEETRRPTIECLPEVVEGAAGKVPVLVDGGFRRGTDVFKALALGARAICVGRPYAWGLGAFGQPGVEAVLTILRRELEIIMRQAGTASIGGITRAYLTGAPR